MESCKCFFCNENAGFERMATGNRTLYSCKVCGNFTIDDDYRFRIDRNHFASYLYYTNKIFSPNKDPCFFYYIGSAEGYGKTHKINALSRLITNDEVEAWYPQKFSEKIDIILLGLAKLSDFIGSVINLTDEEIKSLYFVNRHILDKRTPIINHKAQITTLSDYMSAQKFIIKNVNLFTVLPEGWKRIDELQKNQSDSKQAFIAMPFSEKTADLREAIRQGVENAGYIARFIDEKEHNNQIVPEILHEIRESKFVIAELTDHNNGAYYEAGYAAGLGKEVIHICNKIIFDSGSHFDVKQKAAVLWKKEDEIPSLLCKRIQATIG
jgi:nucleoside 2-deoxyribosyltransferase